VGHGQGGSTVVGETNQKNGGNTWGEETGRHDGDEQEVAAEPGEGRRQDLQREEAEEGGRKEGESELGQTADEKEKGRGA
jgi:hypothetical protein